jgi:hypothetical protein
MTQPFFCVHHLDDLQQSGSAPNCFGIAGFNASLQGHIEAA